MMTPLNAIINLSGIMMRKFEQFSDNSSKRSSKFSMHRQRNQASPENANIMRIINNSAILMKFLVQDFLDLVGIARGTLKLEYKQ